MKAYFLSLCVTGFLSLFTPSPLFANELSDETLKPILEQTINQVIRPRYQAFSQATQNMTKEIALLCQKTSQIQLEQARSAFSKTAQHWAEIELLRMGAILQNHRLERILFYPDRKSTGLKQVQQALRNRDASATNIKQLKNKSVALQGLGALEYMLFDAETGKLVTGSTFQCQYALTIAQNIGQMAEEVYQTWLNDKNISAMFGHTPQETMNLLFGIIVHGLEMVKDQRINAIIGDIPARDKPRLALFWRSENTIPVIAANIEFIAAMLNESGLTKLIMSDDKNGTLNALDFELKQVRLTLNALNNKPVEQIMNDASLRQKIVYLSTQLRFFTERIDQELAQLLGLQSGFSSSDGD